MVTIASALGARAPAMVVDSCHLVGQGWTLALIEPHHQTGGAPVHVDGCLVLLFVMMLIVAYWWV
jgi:hypothetical protein